MWRENLFNLLRGISQLAFPNACWICDQLELDCSQFLCGLCESCYRLVSEDTADVCQHCAATIGPHTDTAQGCPSCREKGFSFDAAIRLGSYSGRLQDAILRMKQGWGEGLADLMGRILVQTRGESLRKLGASAVVPIPLYWSRRWIRGYNQAEALAREIAHGLNIPLIAHVLRRIKQTPNTYNPQRRPDERTSVGHFTAVPVQAYAVVPSCSWTM